MNTNRGPVKRSQKPTLLNLLLWEMISSLQMLLRQSGHPSPLRVDADAQSSLLLKVTRFDFPLSPWQNAGIFAKAQQILH